MARIAVAAVLFVAGKLIVEDPMCYRLLCSVCVWVREKGLYIDLVDGLMFC